jgi:hypothetical protein
MLNTCRGGSPKWRDEAGNARQSRKHVEADPFGFPDPVEGFVQDCGARSSTRDATSAGAGSPVGSPNNPQCQPVGAHP